MKENTSNRFKIREFTETQFENAAKYIQWSLSEGHNVSKAVLSKFDFNQGVILSYLPEEENQNEITDFRWGRRVNQEPSLKWLANIIKNVLSNSPKSLGLLESFEMITTDPVFSDEQRLIAINKKIYFTLTHSEASLDTIEDKIDKVESPYVFNAFFGEDREQEVSKKLATGTNVTVSDEWVKRFIETVQLVIVMAFDGEGYLVWERTS